MDLSVILDIIKNIFSTFAPVVMLIFGVFFGLWIFGVMATRFMDLAEMRASFSLRKPEEKELRILAGLAKKRGLEFDAKKVRREVEAKKEKALFEKLGKKYGQLKK